MRQFLEQVRSGPSFSYVSRVDVKEVAAQEYDSFSIVK
jgi:hypothetical protein